MAKKYPLVLPDFTLTKTHRKLLKHARKRISGHQEEAICIALEHGADFPLLSGLQFKEKEKVHRAKDDLKRYIRRAIERKVYFDTWQKSVLRIDRTQVQVRKDRVKWIDFLLEAGRV